MFRIRFYLAWPFAELAFWLSPSEIPSGYAVSGPMARWYYDVDGDGDDDLFEDEPEAPLGIGS